MSCHSTDMFSSIIEPSPCLSSRIQHRLSRLDDWLVQRTLASYELQPHWHPVSFGTLCGAINRDNEHKSRKAFVNWGEILHPQGLFRSHSLLS